MPTTAVPAVILARSVACASIWKPCVWKPCVSIRHLGGELKVPHAPGACASPPSGLGPRPHTMDDATLPSPPDNRRAGRRPEATFPMALKATPCPSAAKPWPRPGRSRLALARRRPHYPRAGGPALASLAGAALAVARLALAGIDVLEPQYRCAAPGESQLCP